MSTETVRRPQPPPVKKKGECRYCGAEVVTTSGRRSKGTQHDACRKRWERINRPSEVRDTVLARPDGRRCVDCRNVFPESQIEVDHVHGLEHGGDNDPFNYVPRCVGCHDKKTKKEKELRDRTPAKGGDNLVGDVTRVPPPVRTWLWVRAVVYTWLVGSWAWFMAWPFLFGDPQSPGEWWDGATTAIPEVFLAGVGPALIPVAVWRGLVWRRNRKVNAQIVWERLARATGTPNARTRSKFQVHGWRNGMPSSVTIRLDKSLSAADDDARRKLIDEFARVLEVDPSAVEARVGKRQGQVHLAVLKDPPPPPPEVAPLDDGVWSGEVAESLRPVVDEEATVTVVEVDGKGKPTVVHVGYPKRAASRAAKAKVPVLNTMRDSYPRKGREWFIDHDAPGFRYVLTSHPDPLRKTVKPGPIVEPDLFAGIPLGLTETGEPWVMPLAGNAAHLFCSGLSGAGKGSIEWATIRALAPGIRDGWVRLWVIDPKQGAELGALKPMCTGFAGNDDEALPLLGELEKVVDGKYEHLQQAGLRRLDDFTRDTPFDLLLIDEAASLYNGSADKKRNDTMMAKTRRLVNISRAAGVAIHVYTQDPLVQSFPARDLFPRRLALRLGSADHVDRVLGGGAKDGGALAWRIPETQQGVGYLVVNGNTASPLRVRAAYVTDSEIERIVRDYTPRRQAPPTRRVAAVETPQLPAPPAPPAGGTGVRQVRFDDIADQLPIRVYLPDDPDPVTVTELVEDPDEDTRVEVTYQYDGEVSSRVCSFDVDESVTVDTANTVDR